MLAIIGARARKRSGFLLELSDNEATLVLTLSASLLAIVASCLPTEACAHNSCQWGEPARKSRISAGLALSSASDRSSRSSFHTTSTSPRGSPSSRTRANSGRPALRIVVLRTHRIAVFPNKAIENSFENRNLPRSAVREAHTGDRQKRWLSRTARRRWRSRISLARIVSTFLRWRARSHVGEHIGR